MNTTQRRQQIGRVHKCKSMLRWDDEQYRSFMQSTVGKTSCTELSDKELNHLLDWLMYFAGQRKFRPKMMFVDKYDEVQNKVRMLEALSAIVPTGYEVSPIRSLDWRRRMTGIALEDLQEYNPDHLDKLIEGIKNLLDRTNPGAFVHTRRDGTPG